MKNITYLNRVCNVCGPIESESFNSVKGTALGQISKLFAKNHLKLCLYALIALLLIANSTTFASLPCDEEANLEWYNFFTGPGNAFGQQGEDIAIDPDGNIVVTGVAFLSFFRSAFGTIKYSPDGELLWQDIYQLDPLQNSYARALAIDAEGNIYVTGEGRISSGTSSEILCVSIKYAPDGTLLWEHVYETTSINSQPRDITIDPNGDIIVIGSTEFSSGVQSLIIKIDPNGNTIWAHQYFPTAWTVPFAVATDPAGFISVGGTSGIWWSDSHLLVMRYAPDGAMLWSDITSGWGNIEEVWDIAVDGSGHVYALGKLASPDISFSYHLMKYSPDGVKLWSENLTYIGGTDSPRSVAIDPEGNIIVAGSGGVGIAVDNIMIGKYTPQGQLLWSLSHKGDLAWARGIAMALDQQGNIFVTGSGAPHGSNDPRYFTVKVDPDGQVCWSETLGGDPLLGSNTAYAIAVNQQGDAFVTGASWLDFHYYFGTARYSAEFTTSASQLSPNTHYRLGSPNPNPFSSITNLELNLEHTTTVQLEIVDMFGSCVKLLTSGELTTGQHNFSWDGNNKAGSQVPAGMYLIRLQAGTVHETQRLIRAR